MDTTERLIQALVGELGAMRRDINAIARNMEKQTAGDRPGFSMGSGKRYVFVERDQWGNCWHFMGGAEDERLSITEDTLSGLITEVRYGEKISKNGKHTSRKLWVTIATPIQSYILTSGLENVFSRGLISALANLTQEQLAREIFVSVSPGTDEKVVLSRVRDSNSTWVDGRFSDDMDLEGVLAKALQNVATANGKTVEEMMGDRNSNSTASTRPAPVAPSNPPSNPHRANPLTDADFKALRKAREEKGWTGEALKAMCAASGIHSMDQMSREFYDELMDRTLDDVAFRDGWLAHTAKDAA